MLAKRLLNRNSMLAYQSFHLHELRQYRISGGVFRVLDSCTMGINNLINYEKFVTKITTGICRVFAMYMYSSV